MGLKKLTHTKNKPPAKTNLFLRNEGIFFFTDQKWPFIFMHNPRVKQIIHMSGLMNPKKKATHMDRLLMFF